MPTTDRNAEFPFDPTDPSFRADPYPVYRELRENHPAVRGPLGAWAVSRYEDCDLLLRDRRMGKDLGNSEYFARAAGDTEAEEAPFLGLGIDGWDSQLFKLLDPPDHTKLRALVSQAFTPAVIDGLKDSTAAVVDELLGELPDRFDVMERLGAPLPIRVLGDMLSIPSEDHEIFVQWSTEIAHILELGAEPSEDVAIRCQKAVAECTAYFVELLEKRASAGGDDLLSRLARARDLAEGGLTLHQIAAVCVLLVVPGLDTFSNLMGNAAVLFARHPEVLPRLAAEPESADAVLDEILRLEPPTHASWRVALEPVEMHGQTIEPGDVVLLLIAAANRDERVFESPETFALGGNSRKHLSFGRGIHYCAGDLLSRLMAKEAFKGLARRIAGLSLVDEQVDYKPGIWLRGPSRLPVVVEHRAG